MRTESGAEFRETPKTVRRRAISAKVFVGNLNYRTTKEELTAHLGAAGQIVDVHIPTDRETGRPRGFAFVRFSSEEEAAEAIRRFNGSELGGRQLNINAAEDRPRGGPPRDGGGRGPGRDFPPREFRGGGGGGGGGPRRDFGGGPPAPDFSGGRWDTPSHGGDEDRGEGGGGGRKQFRGKGSRRGLRARKRSL